MTTGYSENKNVPDQLLPEDQIDALGHILVAGAAGPETPDYNEKIDVFSSAKEGDRAQIYQMWAIDAIASNPVAAEAYKDFGLSGDGPEKIKWTQLLEHMTGVDAIATHLESLLEKHGASSLDHGDLHAATVLDSLHKPLAIQAGLQRLETAVLVHDLEKPAEVAAGAGGFENSRDNPVLREGRSWNYLHNKGVSDEILLAAQNTGRADRFFGELDDYSDSAVKKALEDRESLAFLLNVDRDVVDAMTPQERRRSSIEGKGRLAALVAISDAMAAQFRFQGISDSSIDAMSAHYLTYKTDPESVSFFGQDWPEYYKEVRKYLVGQVPKESQAALIADLKNLTQQTIFDETILPHVLGEGTMKRSAQHREKSKANVYDQLRYTPEAEPRFSVETFAEGKNPPKNEDVVAFNANAIVLSDGATDKTGINFGGKSGGEIAASIAAEACLGSELSGPALVEHVSAMLNDFYKEHNPQALEDSAYRAAATLVAARIAGDKLIITQVGDSSFRINGQAEYTNDKLVDKLTAGLRKQYIAETGDVAGSRDAIMPLLKAQHVYQNNADHPLGYGVIDGSPVPTKFVKVFEFSLAEVHSLELVSDGYFSTFPEEPTIEAYEALHEHIEAVDPDKRGDYPSTKTNDDRAVAIVTFL